jgi:hypothetical protein
MCINLAITCKLLINNVVERIFLRKWNEEIRTLASININLYSLEKELTVLMKQN